MIWRPIRWCRSRPHSLWAAAVLLFSLLSALPSLAQETSDVAEAARQEKARKSAEAKTRPHVYTNEDLKKPSILVEEDRARVEARKKTGQPPQIVEPTPALDAQTGAPEESLGEVGCRYLREKKAIAAEKLRHPNPPVRFPFDLSQPTFAEPAPVPLSFSVPRLPAAPVSPSMGETKPKMPRGSWKRDPFSRPTFPPASPHLSTDFLPHAPAPRPPSVIVPSPIVVPPSKASRVTPPMIDGTPAKPSSLAPFVPAPRRAAPAPPEVLAASPAPTVAIESGDSLWKLSRRLLGSSSRWQEWLKSNPSLTDPHRIPASTLLVVPHAASYASSGSPAKVLVQKGDSLWSIALARFGSGAAWPCVASANPALHDPNHIHPGQTIILPSACPASH